MNEVMNMATSELQIVLQRAEKLSPPEKVEVIKHLLDSLTEKNTAPNESGRYLIYGEFADSKKMSTEDDFKIAEWHPSEAELNGD